MSVQFNLLLFIFKIIITKGQQINCDYFLQLNESQFKSSLEYVLFALTTNFMNYFPNRKIPNITTGYKGLKDFLDTNYIEFYYIPNIFYRSDIIIIIDSFTSNFGDYNWIPKFEFNNAQKMNYYRYIYSQSCYIYKKKLMVVYNPIITYFKRLKKFSMETYKDYKNTTIVGYETKLNDIKKLLGVDFSNELEDIFNEEEYLFFLDTIISTKYELIAYQYILNYGFYDEHTYSFLETLLSFISYMQDYDELESLINYNEINLNHAKNKLRDLKIKSTNNEVIYKRKAEYTLLVSSELKHSYSIDEGVFEVKGFNPLFGYEGYFGVIFEGDLECISGVSTQYFSKRDINIVAYGPKIIKSKCEFFVETYSAYNSFLICEFESLISGSFQFKMDFTYKSETGIIIKPFNTVNLECEYNHIIKSENSNDNYINDVKYLPCNPLVFNIIQPNYIYTDSPRNSYASPVLISKNFLFFNKFIIKREINKDLNEDIFELTIKYTWQIDDIPEEANEKETLKCKYYYIGISDIQYLMNCESNIHHNINKYNNKGKSLQIWSQIYIGNVYINNYSIDPLVKGYEKEVERLYGRYFEIYRDESYHHTNNIYNSNIEIWLKIEEICNKYYNNILNLRKHHIKFKAKAILSIPLSDTDININNIEIPFILNTKQKILFKCNITTNSFYYIDCQSDEISKFDIIYNVMNYYVVQNINGKNIFIYPFFSEINHVNKFYDLEYKGIDVSKYQGSIDWKKVRADGITYAIIRVGGSNNDGSYSIDPLFEFNYNEARKNDILVGVYWYTFSTKIKDS